MALTPNPDFDGTPLVMGSVVGLRSFMVTSDGTLQGMAFRYPFNPGENIAEHRNPVGEWVNMVANAVGVPSHLLLPPPVEEGHKIASLHCNCGFYAYTTGKNTYRLRATSLTGIIEGYGRVTLGPKGFRAEKARLLALVNPDESSIDGLMNYLFVAPGERSEKAIRFELACKKYPEAKVYPTLRDALAAHPLRGKS